MEQVAAIVLAAGSSSRMGAFKPLLEVEGRTLLERAVSVFMEAGVRDVVVVAGHRRDEVAAAAARAGARVISNPGYDQGMFSSLRMGMLGLDPSVTRFFVLPADVPLVRPETIGRLLRQGRVARGGAAEVVYPLRDGVEGHPPLLDGALRAEIRAADPPGGLRELLLGHAAASAVVEVDDPGVLLDADTPEDLARIRGLAAGEGLPDAARCLHLLAEQGVPRARIDHSLIVTAVATALTTALNERRQHLIAPLVTAGALLHDVAREQPRHAEAGAALLERLGYPRVAAVVRTARPPGPSGRTTSRTRLRWSTSPTSSSRAAVSSAWTPASPRVWTALPATPRRAPRCSSARTRPCACCAGWSRSWERRWTRCCPPAPEGRPARPA